MADDKPLHVRVAEALGVRRPVDMCLFAPGSVDSYADVPRYDTDWSATGPLIERFKFWLVWDEHPQLWTAHWGQFRAAEHGGEWDGEAEDATPLLAVCALILALAEAGKLPRA